MLYIAKITPEDTNFSKFHVCEALSKNLFFLSFSLTCLGGRLPLLRPVTAAALLPLRSAKKNWAPS